MTTVANLISTSVSDARTTLAHTLRDNPQHAAQLALGLLERLRGAEGQTQRRKLAASTLRKAAKAIAFDETPDPQGPRAGDTWHEMSTGELRPLLTAMAHEQPLTTARELVATLVSLRGELQCDTRRKILLGGIGKAAMVLQDRPVSAGPICQEEGATA